MRHAVTTTVVALLVAASRLQGAATEETAHVLVPVTRVSTIGMTVADMDRSVDFYTLGPSEPVSFRLAPGRRRAYGLRQQVGNYEFWTYDLEGRRVAQRTQFRGRPRMGLTPSSNGRQPSDASGPSFRSATASVYETRPIQRFVVRRTSSSVP